MSRVFISLGSNIEPRVNVREALRILGKELRVVAVSTVYETEPVGQLGQPRFYNAVVEAETGIPPLELKCSVLRRIEEELGRVRATDKYAPRTIDLDLLIYDDLVTRTDDLVIPDPSITERPFLALPLCELAPDLLLPGTDIPLREIAESLPAGEMVPLLDYTGKLRRDIDDGPREGSAAR